MRWCIQRLPIFIVLVVAVVSVRPMVSLKAKIIDRGQDGKLIAWIMNQTISKVTGEFRNNTEGKWGWWDGKIFYPKRNVLTYSEPFFVSAIWGVIPVMLSKNPGWVINWVTITGQVLTLVIVYAWWKEMSGKKWAAAVATCALGLAQIRWEYQVHLQMWSMQYWLGGTWLVWKWIREQKTWQMVGAGVLLGLQSWESILPEYFTLAILGVWTIQNWRLINKQTLRAVGLGLGIWIMVAAPVGWQYWSTIRETGVKRSVRDAAHHGMGVEESWTHFGSPGLYVLALVGWGFWRKSQRSEKLKREMKWLVIITALGWVMALGPVLKWQGKTVKMGGRLWVPLPYGVVYYTVPGFEGLRTPSRWIWLSAWGLSGIIAVGLAQRKKAGMDAGLALSLAVAVVGGTGMDKTRSVPTLAECPAVYWYLAGLPGKTVREEPVGDENVEAERMVCALGHQKWLVNGYSGINPPIWKGKPDYVIVHKDQGGSFAEGKLVWEDDKAEIWIP